MERLAEHRYKDCAKVSSQLMMKHTRLDESVFVFANVTMQEGQGWICEVQLARVTLDRITEQQSENCAKVLSQLMMEHTRADESVFAFANLTVQEDYYWRANLMIDCGVGWCFERSFVMCL